MLALVTGGQGFVGSHLCERLLAGGWRVRVLARPTSPTGNLDGLGVEIVRGDLLDPASLPSAVKDCDLVFHLAGALKGFREADFFRVNADGTRALAEVCVTHAPRLRRFVFVSSLAAAGPSPGGPAPLAEDNPPRPVSWYGRSKLAGEEALRSVSGLSWTIVRPPIVFGPRERDLFQYFRAARRGFLPVFGFRDRHFSIVFGPDLAEGLFHSAQTEKTRGQVYYLSAPEIVTWVGLGRLIGQAVGIRGRIVRLPETVGILAGMAADVFARMGGTPRIFSSQKVIEMRQAAWVCNSAKAARDFGWRASTPVAEALNKTAHWYREHGWL